MTVDKQPTCEDTVRILTEIAESKEDLVAQKARILLGRAKAECTEGGISVGFRRDVDALYASYIGTATAASLRLEVENGRRREELKEMNIDDLLNQDDALARQAGGRN